MNAGGAGERAPLLRTVNGTKVYTIAAGPSEPPDVDGPTDIVMVHGLAMSNRYLWPAVRKLSEDRRVFAPDLPGAGQSGKPSHRLTMSELADSLVDWMDVVGVARAVVIGHSVGCVVVSQLADRHSERVTAVVLVSPAEHRPWWQSVWRLALDGTREQWSLVVMAGTGYLQAGPRRMLRRLRQTRRADTETVVRTITQPTLVIRGERDLLVSHEWAQQLANALPSGVLVTLPGAPHAVPYAAVEPFVASVRRFLDRPPSP